MCIIPINLHSSVDHKAKSGRAREDLLSSHLGQWRKGVLRSVPLLPLLATGKFTLLWQNYDLFPLLFLSDANRKSGQKRAVRNSIPSNETPKIYEGKPEILEKCEQFRQFATTILKDWLNKT